MGTFSGYDGGYPGGIPGLTTLTKDGEPYKRPDAVLAQIAETLGRPQSDWFKLLKSLRPETIVFLVRQVDHAYEELYGALVKELNRRTICISKPLLRHMDRIAKEDVLMQVEMKILERVLTGKTSRDGEYLEVAFADAVDGETRNARKKYKRSTEGQRDEMVVPNHDGENDDEKIEHPFRTIPDERLGPEAVLLKAEDDAHHAKVLQKAEEAVKDYPHQREAVRPRIEEDLPIESADPAKRTVVREVGGPVRHVKYLIKKGIERMRKANGLEE